MSTARLLITTVPNEDRSVSEVAREYHVSRRRVHELLRRFDVQGEAAFEPRSRPPHHSPNAVAAEVEDQIVRLRKELTKKGVDAGAENIHEHLARRTPTSQTTSPSQLPAVSTIWRVLARRRFVHRPQQREVCRPLPKHALTCANTWSRPLGSCSPLPSKGAV